jgi:hypothetical protein
MLQFPSHLTPKVLSLSGPLFLAVGVALIAFSAYVFFIEIEPHVFQHASMAIRLLLGRVLPISVVILIAFNYAAAVVIGPGGPSNTNSLSTRGRERSNSNSSNGDFMGCLKCKRTVPTTEM